MPKITKTKNENLQRQLDQWVELIDFCNNASGEEKIAAARRFAESFVPIDIDTADLDYFAGNLVNDQVIIYSYIYILINLCRIIFKD